MGRWSMTLWVLDLEDGKVVHGLGADFKQQAITKDKDELCILIKDNSSRRYKTYKCAHIKTPNYIKQIVTLLTRKTSNLVVMQCSHLC